MKSSPNSPTNPSSTPSTPGTPGAPSAAVVATNGASLRDRIQRAPQVAREIVHIDSWGVDIECRGMTLGQRSRIMREGYTQDEKPRPIYETFYPLLLVAGCYDPVEGGPVFQDGDAALINTLNPAEVDRVARVIMRLSGMSTEGTEKNDGASSPSDTFGSPSPSNSA